VQMAATKMKEESEDTGQRGCRMNRRNFLVLEQSREMLKLLLSELTPNGIESTHVTSDVEGRQKQAALAEPLGMLVEVLFGNPSASTFRRMNAEVKYVEQYIEKIKAHIGRDSEKVVRISKGLNQLSNQTRKQFAIVNETLMGMRTVYHHLQNEYEDMDLALLATNMILGESLQHKMYAYMWYNRAEERCLQKKIPTPFISKAVLDEDLAKLRIKLEKDGYKMSIPDYESSILMKLELADCVWSHS